MALQFNPLYLVIAAVASLLVYHLVYRLALILRDPSLICWGIGLLGVTTVALRKPRISQSVGQLLYSALAMGSVIYFALFVTHPGPISGLPHSGSAILLTVVVPVALVSLATLLAQATGRRYALWGEAHVLSDVQRATALGVILYFTPLGRAFLHDRFNATPSEFIQTIRS